MPEWLLFSIPFRCIARSAGPELQPPHRVPPLACMSWLSATSSCTRCFSRVVVCGGGTCELKPSFRNIRCHQNACTRTLAPPDAQSTAVACLAAVAHALRLKQTQTIGHVHRSLTYSSAVDNWKVQTQLQLQAHPCVRPPLSQKSLHASPAGIWHSLTGCLHAHRHPFITST